MTQIATIILVSLLLLGGYGLSLAEPDERTEYEWLNGILQDEPLTKNFIGGYGIGFVDGVTVGAFSTPSVQKKFLQCLEERRFSSIELQALAVKYLMARGDMFDQVKPATEEDALTALSKLYYFALKSTCQVEDIYR